MGDLRNKGHKFEREDKIERDRLDQQARDLARARAHPLPRCLCGLTWHDTEIIYASQDRWRPPAFYCRLCAPPDIRELCWPEGN